MTLHLAGSSKSPAPPRRNRATTKGGRALSRWAPEC